MKQRVKTQIWKRLLCTALSLAMVFVMFPAATLKAAEQDEMVVDSLTTDIEDTNRKNYFTFSGQGWTKNLGDCYVSASATEERYYEIHFEGNAISVWAVKSDKHGNVKFTVDGEREETVNLYSDKRTQPMVVYSVSGLTEGKHVLKAVAVDKVNQVVSAEITHKPYQGGEPNLGGTIEDTNEQCTQNRYSEIAAKNVSSVNLSAWKNDKATSVLALFSRDCSLENVRVTASRLKSETDSISADHVKTTFIKSVKAYNGTYLGYGDKTRPLPEATSANRSESSDVLYQQGGSIDIGWNSVQPVWVEFDIPKDAAAGVYTGTLTASADGIEEPLTFTYTINVADVVLPDADTFADTFDIELWQYPYSSAEYYDVEPFSEEHLALMESSMLKYKEIGGHAITTTIVEEAWNGQTYSANEVHYPSMVKWTKNGDGSFSYDYTDFDRWVTFCKGLGIGDKIVLYSIAPWHNSFAYWENNTLKYESFTAGNDRYVEVWTDFLQDLIDHLEEKGWFEESYIGIDERGFSTAAFDVIESVTNEEGKRLKTAGAMDAFAEKKDLAMRVDDLNIGDNAVAAHVAEFQDLLKEREEAGLRTTLYSCTEHKPGNFSLSAPAESYWSIINAGKMETAGFLRWAYDAWVEDPLRDATHNAFEPGDCFLIYPDEKDASKPESKSSVRLERMAEGVRDVNKLLYLKSLEPSLEDEINALYDNIKTKATTGRTYLTDSEKNKVIQEVRDFKAGVAKITDLYISLHSEGLHVTESEKTLTKGEKWQIPHILVTDLDNKRIIFASEDPSVATVDAKGIVTARGAGETTITLLHRQTGYTASVAITVPEVVERPEGEFCISNSLPEYKLPEKYLSDVLKGESDGDEHYLGQPDMIMLDDNETLYTVFPVGHGRGRIIMMVSHDAGETWTRKIDIPESWNTSYETPTIYKLNMTDGRTKLIVLSGHPKSFGAPVGGWDSSVSSDGGETWSEFKTHCPTLPDGSFNEGVVVMASLIQLKENGEYIDKWMGVYHDGGSFVNYKSYLTFDEDGNDCWTTPEAYLSKYRDIESSHQICEVGLFRSPDGNRIVGLARNQTHNGPATMFYSDDEGETWSEPVPLPGSLAGERHKIIYDPTDPTGQRVVIPFREIKYDLNGNNQFDGGSDWVAGDWVAWIGTYDDIINRREGSYRILLCEDWSANAKSGDTGYTGFVVQPDGTFIMNTYGHWDKEYSESLPNYNVYNDWCWIKQAKFKLSDLSNDVIGQEMNDMPELSDASEYTRDTWDAYKKALENLEAVLETGNATLDEVDKVFLALQEAYGNLVMKGAGNNDDLAEEKSGELKAAIAAAAAIKDKGRGSYTQASWDAFLAAYNAAVLAANSESYEELNRVYQALTAAQRGLSIEDKKDPLPDPVTKKEFAIGEDAYEMADASGDTVILTKGADKKTVTVNTVTYNNKVYRVVAIAPNAFKNCKKLQTVKIGANVKDIAKGAFNNCRKLQSVQFKGKSLPDMKKNAFKKITNKKLTVKVHKSLRKKASVKKRTMNKLKKAGLKVTLKKIK